MFLLAWMISGPNTLKNYMYTLLGIQHGEIEAPEGWVVKIC